MTATLHTPPRLTRQQVLAGDADDFTTSPLWQAVPAVAAGDVAYLDGQQAVADYGLAGVESALDDLAAQLG